VDFKYAASSKMMKIKSEKSVKSVKIPEKFQNKNLDKNLD